MSQDLQEARQKLSEASAIIDRILGNKPTARANFGAPTEGVRMVVRNDKNYIEIDNKDWFLETCQLLRVHPNVEPRDADAMASLPSGLNKYGSLTEGQWRLFKAIHNKLLGTWPEVSAKKGPSVSASIPEDLSDIPF